MNAGRTLHGSAAARGEAGVLLLGGPGAGKSDLVLRLVRHGFCLIADDQVRIVDGVASAPALLAGMLEVRGLGLVRLPHVSARLMLVVELGTPQTGVTARLPEPRRYPDLDLPVITLDPGAASAPDRIALALDCLQGTVPLLVGAFA
jgi:HPr kinase/phosphorylase